jgi:hypothetical protein
MFGQLLPNKNKIATLWRYTYYANFAFDGKCRNASKAVCMHVLASLLLPLQINAHRGRVVCDCAREMQAGMQHRQEIEGATIANWLHVHLPTVCGSSFVAWWVTSDHWLWLLCNVGRSACKPVQCRDHRLFLFTPSSRLDPNEFKNPDKKIWCNFIKFCECMLKFIRILTYLNEILGFWYFFIRIIEILW